MSEREEFSEEKEFEGRIGTWIIDKIYDVYLFISRRRHGDKRWFVFESIRARNEWIGLFLLVAVIIGGIFFGITR